MLGVLGGIWFGFFTPTEGAGVGAVGALLLALVKGMKPREVWQVVLAVGRTSAPLLLLLVCAQLYSRVLSMTGFTEAAKTFLLGTGLGPVGHPGDDGADLVRAGLPDRLDLDHPADRADLRADRGRISASIRSPSPSSASWRSRPAC